ncbi:hypothetical protein [Rubellimicrobium sp. CFH 75288]|uniref:hypothetical protein n=1 Tax=Rubellimicrobium sp. CFH 75288 TaxID=2697034 RepID=UPI0014128559|nr:hypothetical protein [Rubellimicrobium sp. CFH 75288]NAZ37791.1 hypothetical protein [Rubellimicrobium sp. CFH 75288]
MSILTILEALTYVVTILGLPFAIFIFAYEQRKRRETDEEEVHELLASRYTEFLKLVIAHPELKLRSREATPDLDPDQQDRVFALFEILIALFERAYLLLHEEPMSPRQRRRWLSWEDFMREWCAREDFRTRLPLLLRGEDPDFAALMLRLAREEEARASGATG